MQQGVDRVLPNWAGNGDLNRSLDSHRTFLLRLATEGGPTEAQYTEFNDWLARMWCEVQRGFLDPTDIRSVWSEIGEAVTTTKTAQGLVCCKPHGYAGDFEIIDRIYQQWVSPDPSLAKWDYYFHAQAAPRAVRNRKAYFLRWLREAEARRPDGPVRLLNVGSGPARDVFEHFQSAPGSRVFCDCVDSDSKAIAYAATLCEPYREQVKFHQANALRFRPVEAPHLIWSAGLFDYLDNRLVVVLLRRLWRSLAPGGELVVGNFSPDNPTRAYMELLGEWVLNYRSEQELVSLALQAGVQEALIRIGREPEGINLFLHLEKPFGQSVP